MIYSKSVTLTFINSCFQYSVVFVRDSTAFQNILLCSVPSYSASFPIMFNVFLKLSCESLLIPSSISVASLAPYIGERKIALMALLLDILYFSYSAFSLTSGVFIKPYYTCAYIAPTIKFLLMVGVTPPPLIMNGISCAFIFSALTSCLFRCSLVQLLLNDFSQIFVLIRPLYLISLIGYSA